MQQRQSQSYLHVVQQRHQHEAPEVDRINGYFDCIFMNWPNKFIVVSGIKNHLKD